ncbi:MAG: hypothetical protein KY460_02815, partial [Actinobacteria bacterium]|nr:hypothetical protein [Actinomycetota bacterium]
MLLGLEHIQGYNPTHLVRYDDVIAAANRREQDYHVANLTPPAFDSPVFDLLNGRWVVLDHSIDHTETAMSTRGRWRCSRRHRRRWIPPVPARHASSHTAPMR